MLVVHSVQQRWLAQTQTWLHELVRSLPPEVESHVVCPEVVNLDQFPVEHLHCRAQASLVWKLRDRLRRQFRGAAPGGFLHDRLRALEPALLHSHFAPQGWRDARSARELGLPHVTSFYGYDVNRLPRENPEWRTWYLELFDSAAAILCEGPHMAECIRALGCPAEKLAVQRLGVDVEGLPFRPRAWDGRGPVKVFLAAAFREKKGLPLAVEALGRLCSEVEFEITLIGDATDAPGSQREKLRIQEALARTGLASRTRLTGFLPYSVLLERSLDHHLYLAPSLTAEDGDTEGGAPVALIQMAATGIVVVSSKHCDIPQVILAGETGFLAEEGDLDDLERQLRRSLEARERWGEIASASRRYVLENFDARVLGPQLAAKYFALADKTADGVS